MPSLHFVELDLKKPQHSFLTAHVPHAIAYSFFQSEMLFRANGRSPGSNVQSGILYTETRMPVWWRKLIAEAI